MLYKLTDADGKTYGDTAWGVAVEHTAPGTGALCTDGWIHCYTDPLLAVLLNPIHGHFVSPRLWEAEGDVGKTDHGLKVGCTRLRTVRELPVPVVTTEQRIRFGILCAKAVYHETAWSEWATGWLSGADRSRSAASAASAAAAASSASSWSAAAAAAS